MEAAGIALSDISVLLFMLYWSTKLINMAIKKLRAKKGDNIGIR